MQLYNNHVGIAISCQLERELLNFVHTCEKFSMESKLRSAIEFNFPVVLTKASKYRKHYKNTL